MLIYIHSVGFCIAYSNRQVFLGPQKADKQEMKSAFFVFIRLLNLKVANSVMPFVTFLHIFIINI